METGLKGTAGRIGAVRKVAPVLLWWSLRAKSPFQSGSQTKPDERGFSFIFLFFFPCMCVCLVIISCAILKLVNLDMMIYF